MIYGICARKKKGKMEYLHVKNIGKYHPGYRDRNLIWCKTYFTMLNAEPEFELLCEIDKWRFIAFVMLELQTKKPVPLDEEYLKRKGFDIKKRPILLTLKMLHNFVTVVTQDEKLCSVEKRREEEDKEKNKNIYVNFEELTLTSWNSLCTKYPILPAIKKISPDRRKHLKQRFANKDFVNSWEKVLNDIPDCPFLMGENDRKWVANFDWLIRNDSNYLKILEGKYKKKEVRKPIWKEYINPYVERGLDEDT